MATHSSTLARKISWAEEPGRLPSMGSGVAKSRTRLSSFTLTFHFHALEKEMATHSSVLAWRIQRRGSLVGCRLWGRTESDTTEATQQQQQQYSIFVCMCAYTPLLCKFICWSILRSLPYLGKYKKCCYEH